MKKTIILFVVITMFSSAMSKTWEDKKNQLSIGISSFSVFSALNEISWVGGNFENESETGVINLSYMHFFNKTFGFGGSLSYQEFNFKGFYNYEEDCIYDNYKASDKYITCMGVFQATWLHKKHASLYSKIGLGVICNTGNGPANSELFEDYREFLAAYQLTPIGIDFGGRSLRGLVELGWGLESSLFRVGLRYAF
ncbi:MAG: hypothetical protein KBT20_10605 [Bacteroidales bacterium]|nr:hypothetical protein [Candidatus Liminaster caballi]